MFIRNDFLNIITFTTSIQRKRKRERGRDEHKIILFTGWNFKCILFKFRLSRIYTVFKKNENKIFDLIR